MLIVRCPTCWHEMKCNPSSDNLTGKKKRCVYCGKSFTLKSKKENRIVKKI